ncbi:MAG: hypothetical protein JKY19_09565, partial [Alcanivoracaceae bacterium]|nr:hypothetical protein [Alcanivoracaceae bacterium]
TNNSSCDLNSSQACKLSLAWFSDFAYTGLTPYIRVANSANSTNIPNGLHPLANICGNNIPTLTDSFLVKDFQCDVMVAGDFRFELHKDSYAANSSATVAIAESELLTILPCITDCYDIEILEVGDADIDPINNQFTHQVGAGPIPGSGGVSGGAATYNLPLSIPPGRNGMTPSVSVNYSSKGGNGTLGIGWSISAGSSIYRCPQTLAQDGKNVAVQLGGSTSDRLCLDGQRLMLKDNVQPSDSQYWAIGGQYHTEQNSFAKITKTTAGYTVQTKSGRTNTYVQQQSPNNEQETTWQLVKEMDSFGNNIIYDYDVHGSNEWLLAQIFYTGKDNAPGNRIIAFNYQDRLKAYAIKYLANEKTENSKRLNNIVITTPQGVYRTYGFNYQGDNSEGLLLLDYVTEQAGTSVSTLRTLIQTSWQGTQTYKMIKPDANGLTQIESEVMTSEMIVAFNDSASSQSGFSSITPNGINDAIDLSTLRIGPDITGDGSKELISGGNTLLFYNAMSELKGYLSLTGRILPITNGGANADYNGDGITDLVLFPESDDGFYEIAMWKGEEIDQSSSGSANVDNFFRFYPTPIPKYENQGPVIGLNRNIRSADINNDGLPELIYARNKQQNCDTQICERNIYYRKNLGKQVIQNSCTGTVGAQICSYNPSFGAEEYITTISINTINTSIEQSFALKDFNQDGYVDMIINGYKGELIEAHFYNLVSNPNDFTKKTADQLGLTESGENTMIRTYGLYTDLNADGLEDFLYVANRSRTTGIARKWHYKLNTGKLSTGLFDSETFIDFPGIDIKCGDTGTDDYTCKPKDAAAHFYFSDVNSDGINDLLVPDPDNVLIDVCVTAEVIHLSGTAFLFDESNQVHLDDPVGSVDAVICSHINSEELIQHGPLKRFDFYDHGGNFAKNDQSVYGHKAYIIEPLTDSNGEIIISATGVEVIDQTAPIYRKIGSGTVTGDFFGDGDEDYFNRLACTYRSNGAEPGGSLVCDPTVIKFNESVLSQETS